MGGRVKSADVVGAKVPTAVILTALGVEYNAVREHLQITHEVVLQGTLFEVGNFEGRELKWEVAIAQVGAGNALAGIIAERAFTEFCPEAAMFVGVAGGLKDVKLGDAIAATKVYGYESGKAGASFRPRPEIGHANHSLIQRAQQVVRENRWQNRLPRIPEPVPSGFVGAMAAGEKVIASTSAPIFKFIKAH